MLDIVLGAGYIAMNRKELRYPVDLGFSTL